VVYKRNRKKLIQANKLWGFVVHENHEMKVYRRTPKGFNWYGIPGACIVQMNDLIIYTVGNDRAYSYFSKGLDTEIYPLELEYVKRAFVGDKDFIKLIDQEFKSDASLVKLNDALNSYQFIEVYRDHKKKTITQSTD
jgi:hypothetical protein